MLKFREEVENLRDAEEMMPDAFSLTNCRADVTSTEQSESVTSVF